MTVRDLLGFLSEAQSLEDEVWFAPDCGEDEDGLFEMTADVEVDTEGEGDTFVFYIRAKQPE